MKNKMTAKLSGCFLLLAVGFLMLFSPSVSQAQNSSSACGKGYKYVEAQEQVQEQVYGMDPRTGTVRWHYGWVWKWVGKCVPIPTETNSATLSGRNRTYPNVVRNADGTFRPANGYEWVNAKEPNDFRVKLKPRLVKTQDGKLRPASGYVWAGADPKDLRVKLMTGLIKTEDGFRPAKGYRWANPKDPKDLRVERIP